MTPEDILFEYLKDIIYDNDNAKLSPTSLPAQYQKLAQGLNVLDTYIKEQKKFANTLLSGDFEHNIPSIENGIAQELKEFHSILKHVVWQTQEVAKGDYSQRLEYFGDFSNAFNTMVDQLREREENFKKKNQELLNLQSLFKDLTIDAPYSIIVLNRIDKSISYLNKKAKNIRDTMPLLFDYFYCTIINLNDNNVVITINDKKIINKVSHYRINATSSNNSEDEKIVYIIQDVTAEINQERTLSKLAYYDEMTGLYNRRYAMDFLNTLYKVNHSFVLGFIDIDHLKYCNDYYGHEKGDEYIKEIADFLSKNLNDFLVCRFGGDEFMVIKKSDNYEELLDRLERMHQCFLKEYVVPFNKSFSYGVSYFKNNSDIELSELVSIADRNMYEYKKRNKKDINYLDKRNTI